MPTASSRAGLVLAGGHSRRFGDREKLLATLDGRPLIAHAIAGIAPAVDGVVVNCRADQLPGFRPVLRSVTSGVAVAPDPVEGRGPAAGLAAGLAPVSTTHAAVVAGDMPFVDPAFLESLFDRVGRQDGVVPRLDGHRQVSQAVFRVHPARQAAREAVDQGDGSLQDVVDRLDVDILPEADVLAQTSRRSFTDVNTPEALRAAEASMD